jgi:hypothetical protein
MGGQIEANAKAIKRLEQSVTTQINSLCSSFASSWQAELNNFVQHSSNAIAECQRSIKRTDERLNEFMKRQPTTCVNCGIRNRHREHPEESGEGDDNFSSDFEAIPKVARHRGRMFYSQDNENRYRAPVIKIIQNPSDVPSVNSQQRVSQPPETQQTVTEDVNKKHRPGGVSGLASVFDESEPEQVKNSEEEESQNYSDEERKDSGPESDKVSGDEEMKDVSDEMKKKDALEKEKKSVSEHEGKSENVFSAGSSAEEESTESESELSENHEVEEPPKFPPTEFKLPRTEKDKIEEMTPDSIRLELADRDDPFTSVLTEIENMKPKPEPESKFPMPWRELLPPEKKEHKNWERIQTHCYFSRAPDCVTRPQPVEIHIREPSRIPNGPGGMLIALPGRPIQRGRFAYPQPLAITPPKPKRIKPFEKPDLSDDSYEEKENTDKE